MSISDNGNNIVIVGLGPSGLAAAIEACKNAGKDSKVIAITDRCAYTRDTIFRLDEEIYPYLKELIGIDNFNACINNKIISDVQVSTDKHPYRTIQIKTLEKILYSKLLEYSNLELISLPKRSNSQITGIDKNAHTIKLAMDEKNREIYFKYLIAADGCHHGIANCIQENNIEYYPTQQKQLWDKHARVSYVLPDHSSTEQYQLLLDQGPDNKPTLSELQQMGWTLYSEPEARLFVIDNNFYIGAECPLKIYGNCNSLINEWIKLVLRFHLPQEAIDKLVQLDCGTFEINLQEANRTLTLLPLKTSTSSDADAALYEQSACFFQIGDALRIPHYHTGSGAVVGLKEAQALGGFFASKQSMDDLINYHAKIAEIRSDNRMRVDDFIDKRIEREKIAERKYFACAGRVASNMNSFFPSHTCNPSLEKQEKIEDRMVATMG